MEEANLKVAEETVGSRGEERQPGAGVRTDRDTLRSERAVEGDKTNRQPDTQKAELDNDTNEEKQEIWSTPATTPVHRKRGRTAKIAKLEKSVSRCRSFDTIWRKIAIEDQEVRNNEEVEYQQRSCKRRLIEITAESEKEEGYKLTEEGSAQISKTKEQEEGANKALEEIQRGMSAMILEIKMLRDEVEGGRREARENKSRLINIIEEIKEQGEKERKGLDDRITKLERDKHELERAVKSGWEAEKAGIKKEVKKIVEEEVQHGNHHHNNDGDLLWKVRELENKQEAKDKRDRKNNIIVKGQDIATGGNAEEIVREIIEKVAGDEVGITEIVDMRNGQATAILVKVRSWEEKRKIMEGKRNLAGSKIYIDDDLTEKERAVQRQIMDVAKKEREKNPETKLRIGYKKLHSGEKLWVWDEELEQLVERKSGEERGRGRGRGRGGFRRGRQ